MTCHRAERLSSPETGSSRNRAPTILVSRPESQANSRAGPSREPHLRAPSNEPPRTDFLVRRGNRLSQRRFSFTAASMPEARSILIAPSSPLSTHTVTTGIFETLTARTCRRDTKRDRRTRRGRVRNRAAYGSGRRAESVAALDQRRGEDAGSRLPSRSALAWSFPRPPRWRDEAACVERGAQRRRSEHRSCARARAPRQCQRFSAASATPTLPLKNGLARRSPAPTPGRGAQLASTRDVCVGAFASDVIRPCSDRAARAPHDHGGARLTLLGGRARRSERQRSGGDAPEVRGACA